MTEIVKRAQIKAGMIRMCEPIAFGSDADLLDERAAEITRLRASERSAWNAAADRDEQIERLKAEVERKDKALEGIRKRRYQNRETVNPDNAFQAFGRLNKEICAIYVECDAALTPSHTGED